MTPLYERTRVVVPYSFRLVPPPDMCWFLEWIQSHGLTTCELQPVKLGAPEPRYDESADVLWMQHHRDFKGGWYLYCWFAKPSDAVMFKLTWGGDV